MGSGRQRGERYALMTGTRSVRMLGKAPSEEEARGEPP